ncbi:DUF2256 domain-containing protein [Thalassotalea maritima]|uniref:DUF2256 domain-containing protein n=1 Tax=Thalassotalea maritima TaxID=3242416 RepID=UPI0035290157
MLKPMLVVILLNKSDLPQKQCPVCQRPFAWRKKWRNNWRNNWHHIVYCSRRCRNQRHRFQDKENHAALII